MSRTVMLSLLGILVGITSQAHTAETAAERSTHCASGAAASTAVAQASQALKLRADSLGRRFKLAQALEDDGCYGEAVRVLEAGREAHPDDAELDSRLRVARSLITEQGYIEGLGRAEEAAKLQRAVLRCNQLGDLAACDEALRSKPDDRALLAARSGAVGSGAVSSGAVGSGAAGAAGNTSGVVAPPKATDVAPRPLPVRVALARSRLPQVDTPARVEPRARTPAAIPQSRPEPAAQPVQTASSAPLKLYSNAERAGETH